MISKIESAELSAQLALLCSKIRYDLIKTKETENIGINSLLKTTKK